MNNLNRIIFVIYVAVILYLILVGNTLLATLISIYASVGIAIGTVVVLLYTLINREK